MGRQRIENAALFICDIQEKFRPAIHEFPKLVATAQKMIKASQILKFPVYVTTQNAARLGATVAELSSLLPKEVKVVDKTAFSMMVPELTSQLMAQSQDASDQTTTALTGRPEPVTVMIVGLESHVCVTQTALDLITLGHRVYILADGVSSCNAGERGVALARLAREGCTITTSEGVLFELVGDAAAPEFKQFAGLVKDCKDATREAVEVFCGSPVGESAGGGLSGPSTKL